jgi:hypothetical protein
MEGCPERCRNSEKKEKKVEELEERTEEANLSCDAWI